MQQALWLAYVNELRMRQSCQTQYTVLLKDLGTVLTCTHRRADWITRIVADAAMSDHMTVV